MMICSLVTALSSSVSSVAGAESRFAQPPPNSTMTDVVAADDGDAVAAPEPGYRVPARNVDRDSVRASLVAARARNLAAFRAYQKKGVFPSNTFQGQKLNVWLDDFGHFCAAATIIKMSGQDTLVAQVAEDNNFIRLADVRQGALMDWILTSGFTQDEIAAIQEPFMPVTKRPQPEPTEPVLVDNGMRKTEDARLRARYRVVDRMLVRNEKQSIELAVDRLMKNRELAYRYVYGAG